MLWRAQGFLGRLHSEPHLLEVFISMKVMRLSARILAAIGAKNGQAGPSHAPDMHVYWSILECDGLREAGFRLKVEDLESAAISRLPRVARRKSGERLAFFGSCVRLARNVLPSRRVSAKGKTI